MVTSQSDENMMNLQKRVCLLQPQNINNSYLYGKYMSMTTCITKEKLRMKQYFLKKKKGFDNHILNIHGRMNQ